MTFTGQSQLVTPDGEVVYRAKPEGEDLFIAEIDVSKAQDKSMTKRSNLFEDRRPEYYGRLTEN